MRIDIVSIFPDYLAPLRLSLPGRAIRDGLVELAVHDLRDWTHDRHRTVDDSPYGGGAGMVMKPEPWGEALDELLGTSTGDIDDDTVLVVPTPSGRPFVQRLAHDLAGVSRMVIACGRYEGIDQRVVDHARTRVRVEEVSLGDVVLNGGEVAALAVVEAVVRLLPGFMGNPESLAEESHAAGNDGLLEYPVYTKPATWRGLDVPPVLLAGDHGRVAAWRREQSVRRTVERRPDLLPATATVAGLDGLALRAAQPADIAEWHVLQLACWVAEQHADPDTFIPPLHESLDDVRAWWPDWQVRVLRTPDAAARLVGGFRGRLVGEGPGATWEIGRLMVAPDLRGRGLGRALLQACEQLAPQSATSCSLITGALSERNQRLYRRAGYRPAGEAEPGAVRMVKPLRRPIED